MCRSDSAWRRFPISPHYVRFFLTPLPKIVYKWPYQEASFICFLNSILKLLNYVPTPCYIPQLTQSYQNMLWNFDKSNFFFIYDSSCFRCYCFSNLFFQIILLSHFHNKDLIQFQTSSQSKIRIRAFILIKCILGFVLFKWKLLNHNLEQTACRNG